MEEIARKETMTSLDIAEVTGMRHADVMRSIRNMEEAWMKVSERNFALSSYKQAQPNGGYKDVPCYVLNKTECLYVATKFNDEARAKLVFRVGRNWKIKPARAKSLCQTSRILPKRRERGRISTNRG